MKPELKRISVYTELELLIKSATLSTRSLLRRMRLWPKEECYDIAYDLTYDALLELLEKRMAGELVENDKLFVFRYIKNRIRRKEFKISKKQQVERNNDITLEDMVTRSVDPQSFSTFDGRALLETLNKQQQAIVFFINEGYTHEEISAIMAIPKPKVSYEIGKIRIENNRRFFLDK